MVAALNERKGPFGLVVTGEAEAWQPALEMIVGPSVLRTYRVRQGGELLEIVRAGLADAAVIDEGAGMAADAAYLLRMIRRVDTMLPVVVVTSRVDRRHLEDLLRLAAFSVVARPLELEELLRQVHRMMLRIEQMLRYE